MNKLISLISVFFLLGCISSKKSDLTIKIGVIVPLTGEYAEYGKTIQNALTICMDDICIEQNKFKYELVFEDDQAQPKMAISAIEKLITTDNIKYVIGGFTSSSSVAIYPIAERNKVILFSPSSSTPTLSKNTPYFFRNWPSDEVQAKKYASYTYKEFGKRKVSTVYSVSDYGMFVNKIFTQQFKNLGGDISGQYGYTPNNNDFRTIITKLKEENPDAVWLFGYYNEIGNFLLQGRTLGLKTQFFGQEGIESNDLINIAKDGANGLIYFVPYFDPNDRAIKDFSLKYETKFKTKPEVFGIHAYDVMMIYKQLIEKFGNDPEIIKSQIVRIKNYKGLSGITTFDEDGNAFQPLMKKTIINQKFKNIN